MRSVGNTRGRVGCASREGMHGGRRERREAIGDGIDWIKRRADEESDGSQAIQRETHCMDADPDMLAPPVLCALRECARTLWRVLFCRE